MSSTLAFHFIQIIAAIPEGRVSTYGQVARLAGYPGYARQVGSTLSRLPQETNLPWHRVLNSKGRISLSPASNGYVLQKSLLEDEGVQFRGDKVSLTDYGWRV